MTEASPTNNPDQPIITEITPCPRDPNIRRIRVGRRLVGRLPASEIERLELAAGQPWTEARSAEVHRAMERAKARKAALSAIGQTGRSRAELIERLKRRFSSEIAEQIADECTRDGWIDDEALGREIVQQTLARKPAAKRLLIEKLQRRGLDPALAERIIREECHERDAVDDALTLAKSKLRTMVGHTAATKARRLAGLLHRRGFDQETIEEVMQQVELVDEA